MITQERLKELLTYNLETGEFVWIKKTNWSIRANSVAGCVDGNGYVLIQIDKVKYKAHRLAFLYVNGKFPDNCVDHINCVRTDNKWVNLRECINSQNSQNTRRASKNNSTGYLGVIPIGDKFVAVIGINYKQYQLGKFNTPKEAHEAYVEAKRKIHEFGTL